MSWPVSATHLTQLVGQVTPVRERLAVPELMLDRRGFDSATPPFGFRDQPLGHRSGDASLDDIDDHPGFGVGQAGHSRFGPPVPRPR